MTDIIAPETSCDFLASATQSLSASAVFELYSLEDSIQIPPISRTARAPRGAWAVGARCLRDRRAVPRDFGNFEAF